MDDEIANMGVCAMALMKLTRAEQERVLFYLQDRFVEHPVRGEARGEDKPSSPRPPA